MADTLKAGAVDPTSLDDPRFDPEDDLESEAAHEGIEEEEVLQMRSERQDEIQNSVQRGIETALDHFKENIEPDLVDATKYYRGDLFDDDSDLEGRSSVVSTDVRDATLAQLPSLMRIFFGSQDAVEFRPRGQEDVAMARQMTEYINYVIREDNEGFTTFHSLFKDALVRRLGVVKWWWDDTWEIEATSYTGITEQDLLGLLMEAQQFGDDQVDYEVTGVHEGNPMLAQSGMPGMGMPTLDCTITRKTRAGKIRLAAIPREEFVYTPASRSIEDAPLIAHVREVPKEELLQMGVPEDIVEDAQDDATAHAEEDLEEARRIDSSGWDRNADEDLDESQRPVLFAEAYTRVDGDGDGIGELRKFHCVGRNFEIVNGDGFGEIVNEVPFAVFCPDPEPHTMEGLSNFDLLKDVQKIKSHVQRATLNSLAAAVEPITEVVMGEVNMKDLLSPEINKIVRVNKPGMMREVAHRFVGGDTLPVLEYFDSVKEDRTGITKAAAGLDADSFQSSTKAAVAATLSAAQQRIEMIARIFAETGMKRLFKGLLGLAVEHQDRERMVRLRNEWVPVTPSMWDPMMDVQVNVALGQGPTEEKVSVLSQLIEKMEQHIQMGSPLFDFTTLRNAYAKVLEATGEADVSAFLKPWDEQMQAQFEQQQAQQPPEPDPTMILAQIEQTRLQMEMEEFKHKKELDWWTARNENDRERDELARDTVLKEHEIEAKYGAEIADAELRAAVEKDRADQEADMRRRELEAQERAQVQSQEQTSE